MDHRYLPGDYYPHRDYYVDNNMDTFVNDISSDIQEFSDERENWGEMVMSSPSAPGGIYQRVGHNPDYHYTRSGRDLPHQHQDTSQGYASCHSRVHLRSNASTKERPYYPPNNGQVYGHEVLQNQWPSTPMYSTGGDRYKAGTHIYEEPSTISPSMQLRPVSELPDIYRTIFKFGVFNAVQSACFDTIYHSDQNMVISAPTGSGKTVVFELAIIRLLNHARECGRVFKCVYVSPTKALCAERCREWDAKFGTLGIKCCELTGDTIVHGNSTWSDARNASIIITTAEKWDSLTRTWRDHDQVLSQIKVFLVDEVHVLNESRGSTLEVVISRMKTRGIDVRFVMVSATVPNIQDVASWIGRTTSGSIPCAVLEFGEEYRPCKLGRVIVGVSRSKGLNDFAFAKTLDSRLFGVLQTHSVGKPILIFCPTRNGVFATAEQLKKDYLVAESKRQDLPWRKPPQFHYCFYDKRTNELANVGIGVHHAGLTMEDRRSVEDLFLKGTLRIMVATSTLAVGINLPAHTVVIKGVHIYQNGANVEYSDLDIMQMIGRAGRPQFDTEGLAIILCESTLEHKYRALAQGATNIESSLHRNLAEHLNSEVGLGTIASVSSAKDWLRNSFLFQRIRKNPSHYALGKEENQTWEERMDDLVVDSFTQLANMNLIDMVNDGEQVRSTAYGNIMSKLYIRQRTMDLILKLPEKSSARDILETLSSAEEFQESRIRISERTSLNKLRQHGDMRYGVKKIEKTSDKVFIIIQAILGGISLNLPEYRTGDSQPHLEALAIFRHVSRIMRAIVEVAVVGKRGSQMKHALELLRSLSAKAWEDRPVLLRQIEQIGEKSLKVLAENGISSLQELRKQDPSRIEILLNRRPPFGQEVVASAKQLPQYTLEIEEKHLQTGFGKDPIEVELSVLCGLVENDQLKVKKPRCREPSVTVVYTTTSDMDFVDFRRISTKSLRDERSFNITVKLFKPSQSVIVTISSETVAGVAIQKTYKPDVAPSEYPVPDTRPPAALDAHTKVEDKIAKERSTSNCVKEPIVSQSVRSTKDEGTTILHVKDIRESSKVLQKLNNADTKNKMLPNGNYECNHSCKEKAQCRHLCCKEGLLKPPKRFGRAELANNMKQSMERKDENQPPHTDTNNLVQKLHPLLTNLDFRHASAEVEKGLGIMRGQRIRLSYPTTQSTAMNTGQDNAGGSVQQKTKILGDLVSRDSESDYSDPEMDSMIRALPLDNNVFEKPRTFTPQVERYDSSVHLAQSKRKASFLEEPVSPKRAKYTCKGRTQVDEFEVTGVELPASDSVAEAAGSEDEIEIVEGPVYQQTIETLVETVDEFAELDAWLNSGAVDIVYD